MLILQGRPVTACHVLSSSACLLAVFLPCRLYYVATKTAMLQNYLTINFFHLHQQKINVTAECSYFCVPQNDLPFFILAVVDLAQNVLFFFLCERKEIASTISSMSFNIWIYHNSICFSLNAEWRILFVSVTVIEQVLMQIQPGGIFCI